MYRSVASAVLIGTVSLAFPAIAQPVPQQTPAVVPATPNETPTQVTPARSPEGDSSTALAVTSGVDMVIASAYVWRGFVVVDDVTAQPNVWLKIGGITVASWMNVASTRPNGDHLTEHDLSIDYTASRGKVSLSAGYVNYIFPDLDRDRVSHEVYAGISHASYFAPSIRVYHDFYVGTGTYISFGASHTYSLPWRDAALTPSVALGYNHHQWIDVSTFSDLALGLKAKVPTPLPRVSLAPFVMWSRSLAGAQFPSRLVYGIGMSVQ